MRDRENVVHLAQIDLPARILDPGCLGIRSDEQTREMNIERYYRDSRLLSIGEGTNTLQRLIIARPLVERNPI